MRAIGQALEVLNVKVFNLLGKGNDYLIWGWTGRPPPPPLALKLCYTPEYIERLEREGRASRRDPYGRPYPYSLSQILRGVGIYMDQRGGHFLALSRYGESVTIRYETKQGVRHEETHPDLYIRDICVQMYLRRELLRLQNILLS